MTLDIKNLLLIATVLAIAAVIGIYIPYIQYQKTRQDIKNPPTNTNGGSVVAVLYTNKGFRPNIITVKNNTIVEWVNTSDKLMWVASDPHPSHTNLPGFDQRDVEGNVGTEAQGLVPSAYAHTGQTGYRYTFPKVGRWDYHNHLVPFDRGIVIVE